MYNLYKFIPNWTFTESETLLSSDTLQLILTAAVLALSVGNIMTSIRRNQSVKGSYPRYVAASWFLVTGIAVIGVTFAKAALYVATGEYVAAGFQLALVGLWVWIIRSQSDEDNWFNSQWKRLKKGVKALRQRIASLAPSPLPSPV